MHKMAENFKDNFKKLGLEKFIKNFNPHLRSKGYIIVIIEWHVLDWT